MHLKKGVLLVTTLLFIHLPLSAQANLETFNHTDEDSSVRVTSGSMKPCSADAGIYTPRRHADGTPGYLGVKDNEISAMCLTSRDRKCTADIYNTSNCTGSKVGTAELSLVTKSVTRIDSLDSRYIFSIEKNGTSLSISYAK